MNIMNLLQMIELYLDSSGEVDISSGPKGSDAQSSAFANVISSTEDKAKISELKETIKSLKTQIEVRVVCVCVAITYACVLA